ncbi:toll/interleukin-1 receptor domain-containing protein [Salininema proteolyticum]|uniref:TIR domain-containing protein n=1 Tax=Salininema proteolyticum TaxID=1607685 RepID=A0ABV8TXI5_9ACTN
MENSAEAAWDVFISYARRDREDVRPIAALLEDHGFRVFMDESGLSGFTSISEGIKEAIASSRLVLAYFSRTFPTRTPCQWELDYAYRTGLKEGNSLRRLLIVNPEPTRNHIGLSQLSDVIHWETHETSVPGRTLLADLRSHVSELTGAMGEILPPTPTATPGFVGRIEELWRLHSHVGEHAEVLGRGPSPRIAAVVGMPGVGKTELVREYAHRYGSAFPAGVRWADDDLPDHVAGTLTVLDEPRQRKWREWVEALPIEAAAIVVSRTPVRLPVPTVDVRGLRFEDAKSVLAPYGGTERADQLLHYVDGHPQTLHVLGMRASEGFPAVLREWLRPDSALARSGEVEGSIPGGYSGDIAGKIGEVLPPETTVEFDVLRVMARQHRVDPVHLDEVLRAFDHVEVSAAVVKRLSDRGLVEKGRLNQVAARVVERNDPAPDRSMDLNRQYEEFVWRAKEQQEGIRVIDLEPTEREKEIAFRLQTELSTRISTVGLERDSGILSEALQSLYTLLRLSRSSITELGLSGHSGRARDVIAQVVDILHPFLREWHPRLTDHDSVRPEGVGVVSHERAWDLEPTLRTALDEVQGSLVEVRDRLREISGASDV